MSKSNPSVTPPAKSRRLKKLLIAASGLLLLLVIAWFVVTSEAFFKGVILPQAGKAMNATLTAESASISPFSQVTIRGLKLTTTDSKPLLTVAEVRAQYSLAAIMRGTLKVDELMIDSPVVHVVVHEDGTSNLDALSQGKKAAQPETPTPTASGPPPQVDLKQFTLKNATLRYTREHAGGTRDTVGIKDVNVTLAEVRNGATGKLEFALNADARLNPPETSKRGTAQLNHDGKYTFTLGPDLFPTRITGSDRTDVTEATGALAGLAGLGADLAVEMTPTQVERIALSFRDRTNSLGELLLSGPFDALKREGHLTLSQKGIDGKLLNRLGEISGMSFGSPTVTFTNTITLSAGGTTIKVLGRLAAANLRVSTANQPAPTMQAGAGYDVTLHTKSDGALQAVGKLALDPFISRDVAGEFRVPETSAHFDITRRGNAFDLTELRLTLPPTPRAANELRLTGHVDTTAPEAISGALKLSADVLDLTDLYAQFTRTAADTAAATPTTPADGREPDPVTLPLSNFVCELNLGRVYLREIDVSSIAVKTTLDGSRVSVKPLQCVLNGAPIKGSMDLNLGVAGFEYDFNLDAPGIPLAPLVDSFVPASKGQIAGALTAAARLKGAGVTGPSLQKHLGGQFDLVATNLNLSLNNVRTPAIRSLINVVVAIPDFIRSPGAALGNLLGGITGSKGAGSGWVDELMRSPLDGLEAHGAIGGGKVELKQAYAASRAFLAETSGTLDIANVLSNSVMQFPVRISLSKSLSDKAGLTRSDTPTNAVYVALPDFVTMRGTLSLPDPDVNKLVLAQLALKSGAGVGRNIGGAAGETVGGVLGAMGNLLGGGTTPQTNAPASTNAPAARPAADLIKGIGGLFGGKKQAETNAPASE